MMVYYVCRVALNDDTKIIWMTDDYEEALMVRDTCYKALEQEQKNGEFVENYRYIIVKDI